METAVDELELYGYAAEAIRPLRAFLATTLLERGDTSGARRALGRAPAAAEQSYPVHWWLMSDLRVLVAEKRAEEALTAADELERRSGWIVNPAAGPWRSLTAEALDLLDRRDEALALAEAELEFARQFGAPARLGDRCG
jgi:hypothetical protein